MACVIAAIVAPMAFTTETAAATKHTHPSWFDGRNGEYCDVYIKSRRVRAFWGVHHYIACDGIDSKWRVYEWGTGTNNIHEFYACEKIHERNCVGYLGKHKLSDVWDAACLACTVGPHDTNDNNCNHWTERVAAILGHPGVKVHWNCSCVL